jgi:exopolyphosphatase/guanosine-5'-triphosphate,3'-diphosphate pyrophosphatase
MKPRARIARGTALPIAVIDIGTNSVKLTVASVAGGRMVVHHTAREATRLGRGLARSGRIDAASARRTAAAVARLARSARAHGADRVVAVGTYALRAARNGRAVARAIATKTNIEVRVLTGTEEAAMVLASVRSRMPRHTRRLTVVDIGGGSAEMAVARGQHTLWSRSVPLGAVRLTEQYLHHDPIAPEEYARMTAVIDRVVSRLFRGLSDPDPASSHFVASGGTATTAASMAIAAGAADPGKVSVAVLRQLETRCLAATIAQRRHFPGLLPDRADIIPAGLAVLLCFARHARKRSVRIVEGGVRDGVILALAEKASRSQPQTRSRARTEKVARKGR